MYARNFFCLNDWNIKSFFIIILSAYLLYCSSIALNILGCSIPFLQQIVGFFLLLFVPGFLLLRILKLHALSTVETVAYTIGISLSVIMLVGFFINLIFPSFGVTKPLSLPYILLAFSIVVAILGLLSYLYDREYCYCTPPATLDLKPLTAPVSLVIYAVPCISVIGSFLIGRYQNNALSLGSIILIAVLVLWITLKRPAYPEYINILLIISISLSLLFGDLLISEYPKRLNVDGEYYFLNQVFQNNYWDSSIFGSANAVLSIGILGSVFLEVLGVDPFMALKIIYPLIFASIPVILYTVYKRGLSNQMSLFAVLFYMFNFYYFTEALLLRRQQVALFFVVLLVLILTDKRIALRKSSILYILFTISLVVSHYAVSMNWILIVILTSSIYILLNVDIVQIFSNRNISYNIRALTGAISIYHICFLVAIFLVWYMYVGFSALFSVVHAGGSIIENLVSFMDISSKSPMIPSAMGVGFWDAPTQSKLYRLLQYAAQGFIIIGVLKSIYSRSYHKLDTCFQIAAIVFLIASIVLPFMSIIQNVARIYFITLIFLAPCCIYGAYQVYHGLCRLYGGLQQYSLSIFNYRLIFPKKKNIPQHTEGRLFYASLVLFFLIPFFLFNVGFMFDIGGFNQDTRALARIPNSDILSYAKLDTGYHVPGEIILGLKIPQYLNSSNQVYADTWAGYDIVSADYNNALNIPQGLQMPEDSYLFMRSWNINAYALMVRPESLNGYVYSMDIPSSLLPSYDYIYSNGYASLYKVR